MVLMCAVNSSRLGIPLRSTLAPFLRPIFAAFVMASVLAWIKSLMTVSASIEVLLAQFIGLVVVGFVTYVITILALVRLFRIQDSVEDVLFELLKNKFRRD